MVTKVSRLTNYVVVFHILIYWLLCSFLGIVFVKCSFSTLFRGHLFFTADWCIDSLLYSRARTSPVPTPSIIPLNSVNVFPDLIEYSASFSANNKPLHTGNWVSEWLCAHYFFDFALIYCIKYIWHAAFNIDLHFWGCWSIWNDTIYYA